MYLYFLYFPISLDSPLPSKTNPRVKSLYVYVHIPGNKNQILTLILIDFFFWNKEQPHQSHDSHGDPLPLFL